jgi:hypothetical protein
MTYVATSSMGAAARARLRRDRRSRNAIAALRRPHPADLSRVHRFSRRSPAISSVNYMGDCGVVPSNYCDGLGFSLKPPKRLRKAFKSVGRFVKKHETALLVGAGVLTAGLLAPAAALAVGRGALAAGRFVGREAMKLIPRGSSGGTGGTIPDPSDTGTPAPPAPPAAPSMPDLTLPAQTGGGSSAAYPQDYGAGAGGGAPSQGGDTPTSDQAVDTSTPPKQAGMNPVVVIGGLALLGLAFSGSRKR